ncbi:unnamed protein product [Cyprideis torosa]|uniref:Uncharacterized protein n=1 Tax=Cyprideis torosa TaxID=163714 RepID=A0A7R8ZSF9_9CRUS|nr:unnamed protein product [Cyprideis torosa]CAG0906601.1 unnamed protein product [Cyprideis torosa]
MSLSVWAFIAICLFMLERNGSEGSAGPYNSHNPSCTSPCPPVSQCPSVDNCVHGVGQDYCGCCLKCLKV